MYSRVFLILCVFGYTQHCYGFNTPSWMDWIGRFGHDDFQLPAWIQDQMRGCTCSRVKSGTIQCVKDGRMVTIPSNNAKTFTFCEAKLWLLLHMPEFDLAFLPPSVTVPGKSMLDDNVAFALMAQNVSSFAASIPMHVRLAYILPYGNFHEARVNWRPLLFSKFFALAASASSTVEAMQAITSPPWSRTQANAFLNWTGNAWPADPANRKETNYFLQWGSSSSPPVLSPFDFTAYGYASCSGWATLITYVARAVGIPARTVGTPCWNGGIFKGLAKDNKNVSLCWQGGNGKAFGDSWLNNHNWVEYWDSNTSEWVYINDPPQQLKPDTGLCKYSPEHGCNWDPQTGCSKVNGGPAAAMRDHEIFAVTWTHTNDPVLNGGQLIDAADLKLTNGESVSPFVWSPNLASPLDNSPLKNVGVWVINRTHFYRCRD